MIERKKCQGEPFVSVIVPTFNDTKELEICLRAFEQQTYPSSKYEVIVVDNGSRDDVRSAVRQFPHVAYHFEARPGAEAARNKGIQIAQGEILAFTDADCIPDPNWIEQGIKKLSSVPGCGMVGGKIELLFKDKTARSIAEFYDQFFLGFPQQRMIRQKYCATANLFIWRRVIDEVGSLNERFISHGDKEWGLRIASKGYPQAYAENACVFHPARSNLKALGQWAAFRSGAAYIWQREIYKRSHFTIFKGTLKGFLPDMKRIQKIRSNGIPERVKYKRLFKIKLIAVDFFVRSVWALETLRLLAGGKPRRARR